MIVVNMKIAMTICLALGAAAVVEARPGPGRPGGGRPPAPRHHHDSAWGRGGRNFWPGFVGGIVGGVVADTVLSPSRTTVVTTPVVTTPVVTTPVVVNPAPVVVTPAPVVVAPTPVYTTQQVWVEGRYVDQVQANGTVLRVWSPGHYETRQVLVQ